MRLRLQGLSQLQNSEELKDIMDEHPGSERQGLPKSSERSCCSHTALHRVCLTDPFVAPELRHLRPACTVGSFNLSSPKLFESSHLPAHHLYTLVPLLEHLAPIVEGPS